MNQLEERVYQNQEDDEIDLMELLRILLNHKLMLIGITVITIFISGIAGYIFNQKNIETSVVIALNYPELESGLNPDKTPFTKENLISIKTLNLVFDEYEGKAIKAKKFADFRNSLKIEGIIPENISQKIESSLKKGEIISYYPTEYKIRLKELNKEVLEKLSIGALEEFEEKYKPKSKILPMKKVNNFYDYDDYILLLNEKIKNLKLVGESKVIKNILDEYKPTNRQLVVPSIGEMGIKLESENEYYSKLIEKYLIVNTSIKNVEYEIKFKEEEILKIVYPTEKENKVINENINLLVDKLNKVIEDTNNINKEYYEVKYGEMIKILTPVEVSKSGKSMAIFLAVGAVLGLFTSIFLIFICEFVKNYKAKFSFKN